MTKEELKALVDGANAVADKAAAAKFIKDNHLSSDIKDEDDIDVIRGIILDELKELGKDIEDKKNDDDSGDKKDDEPEDEFKGKSATDIAKILIKKGAKSYKRDVVNVTVTEFDTWTRIALTLNKPIKGFVAIEDEATGEIEYKLGITKVMFTSLYALNAVLKTANKHYREFANDILSNHEMFPSIIMNASIDIVSEFIEDGTPYKNPFSDNAEETEFDGDRYINNVYDVKLDETGLTSLALMKMKKIGATPTLLDMMSLMK